MYSVLNYSTDKERMAECKLRLQVSPSTGYEPGFLTCCPSLPLSLRARARNLMSVPPSLITSQGS